MDDVTLNTLKNISKIYFSLLYGMYPCNFFNHLKQLIEKKGLSEQAIQQLKVFFFFFFFFFLALMDGNYFNLITI